jgi:nucleotide-binding universal stress UspA family protein
MKILLAVDGSEAAERATALVRSVAWPARTEIRVISVVRPFIDFGEGAAGGEPLGIPEDTVERVQAAAHAEAERVAGEAAATLTADDRVVQQTVLEGRPPDAIVAVANQINAELIAVGSRGRGAIGSAVLGSVSSEVVDSAGRSVLVVRQPQVTRVVLADDGSADAAAAREVLVSWPAFRALPVRVVTVKEPSQTWYGWLAPPAPNVIQELADASRASAEAHASMAAQDVERLKAAGLAAEPDVRDGDAGSQILESAKEFGADLIVMGTHGRSGLDRLLVGSVTRKVLHMGQASVLIARSAPEASTPG